MPRAERRTGLAAATEGSTTLLALWFSLGGHFVEVLF